MVEPLGPDLYQHLVNELHDIAPDARRDARWVMSAEWWDEVREMTIAFGESPPGFLEPGVTLLGKPVEVRDDGGVPHLEPA